MRFIQNRFMNFSFYRQNMRYFAVIFFIFVAVEGNAKQSEQNISDQNVSTIEKINIGVIPFENSNNNKSFDWVGFGLEYLLEEKLSKLSSYYKPQKSIILNALEKRGLNSQKIDADIIYQIGRETGIDIAILGDYKTDGKNILLEISYISAFTGAPISNKKYFNNLKNVFRISSDIIKNLLDLTIVSISPNENVLLNRQMTSSITAFENFCLGYLEYEKPDTNIQRVAKYFKTALEIDSTFWEAHYNLGILYYNSQKYDLALEKFKTITKKFPGFEKAFLGLGLIYYKKKDFERAKDNFVIAIDLNPNEFLGYYYLGKISLDLRKFNDAEKYLEKSIEINPNHSESYYQIGNVWYAQELYAKSIPFYRKCIEINQDHIDAKLRLGESYFKSQVYYRALMEFESILTLDPNNANAYFMIGTTVYKQAVLNDLLTDFFNIVDPYKPFKSNTIMDSVSWKTRERLYKKMADSFYKAQQINKNFIEAKFNLALTYKEMGEYDKAIDFFNETIRMEPTLIKAHIQIAHTYELMGLKRAALKKYKEVIEIDPSYFVAHPTLSATHQYINIVEIFINELKMKLKENPTDLKANQTLANIYFAQGYYGPAADIYKKILKHFPDNNDAKEMLKKIDQI